MSHKGCKHLTTEQKSRAVELHREGRSTADSAEILGCSVYQVRHALKTSGIKPPGSRGKCCRNADVVRELASQGATLSEIGRRVGCNHTKVRNYLRRHGIPYTPWNRSGSGNPSWKGGRIRDKQGYVLVLLPDHPQANRQGYVREHRLVMEQALGRFLTREEVVHHRDNDPGNNDPDNLELFGSNAEHLAETLAGQCPQWTPEGFQKIQERWSRLRADQRTSNHLASEPSGQPSQETTDRSPG